MEKIVEKKSSGQWVSAYFSKYIIEQQQSANPLHLFVILPFVAILFATCLYCNDDTFFFNILCRRKTEV